MDIKEKLVELLKRAKAKEQCDFWFADIDSAIDMPCGVEFYANYLVANGVTVQEWISVKDRLPDLHTTVLVYDRESKRDLFWYDENGFNVVDEYGYTYPVKTVTHWMPLPPAPEGE